MSDILLCVPMLCAGMVETRRDFGTSPPDELLSSSPRSSMSSSKLSVPVRQANVAS